MPLCLPATALHAAAFACCCGHAFAQCIMLLQLCLYAAAAFACTTAIAWADAWHSAVVAVFACYYCLCMLLH